MKIGIIGVGGIGGFIGAHSTLIDVFANIMDNWDMWGAYPYPHPLHTSAPLSNRRGEF